MKEFFKIIYEFVRFFLISIPVFCVVCMIAMVLVVVKQIALKIKLSKLLKRTN
jgi:hypothetical protein